eukprot:COSAG06_NODE_49227_length_327_cov_0.504386_1_plen_77_part_01
MPCQRCCCSTSLHCELRLHAKAHASKQHLEEEWQQQRQQRKKRPSGQQQVKHTDVKLRRAKGQVLWYDLSKGYGFIK